MSRNLPTSELQATNWEPILHTVASYTASAVKIYNTASSLVRFEYKSIFSTTEIALADYNAGVVAANLKVVGLAPDFECYLCPRPAERVRSPILSWTKKRQSLSRENQDKLPNNFHFNSSEEGTATTTTATTKSGQEKYK
jgi:hypothetical protein